jgi:hypothetical protein
MYTAMAARRLGAQVSLFAPRPVPLPATLEPVAARLHEWLGPAVALDQLPRFEIAHDGGATSYLGTFFGAESSLAPESLPDDLSAYDIVHVVPLGDVHRQHAFVRASRARGARIVSAGTYVRSVLSAPDAVRQVMDEADVFFMNSSEAEALFGSLASARTAAGKLLLVTLGPNGAHVIQGGHVTEVPPVPARQVDPTGAGDCFCGAVLAGLAGRRHPVMAARSAVPLAAAMIEQVGPAALLLDGPPPAPASGSVVMVDAPRVAWIADLLARLDDAAAFDFVGPELPPVGHPMAVEYFFAATLQQFGFWSEKDDRFAGPMIAPLDGKQLKGSFYLFAAFLRRMAKDPGFCSPARQATLTREELLEVFRADDGSDPMPALDLHLAQARQYGADMLALGLSPRAIVECARASALPLQALVGQLDRIGGYKEDPLRKKSSLLALILSQRPERFLGFGHGEDAAPVIDYHLMRSCLRTGLIEVRDEDLAAALAHRQVVGAREEWAVREAAYRAIEAVTSLSGRSPGAVDWFFFSARQRCPEMCPPDCAHCPVDPVCAHRTGLFQPVCRTTFY